MDGIDGRKSKVARRVIADGARTIIYTDVERDGMPNGPDIAGAVALQRLGAQVVASGGVSKLDDLRAVRAAGPLAPSPARHLRKQVYCRRPSHAAERRVMTFALVILVAMALGANLPVARARGD
jgi:hypothetical protein